MHAVDGLAQLHFLHPLTLPQSIDRAVRASHPDLIIPADDASVCLLHDLAARRPEHAPLVERSLGHPRHYALLRSRRAFLDLAHSLAIPCSATRLIDSRAAIDAIGCTFPTVLKYDGTSGGYGVVLAHNAEELHQGYRMLMRHRLPLRSLKRLFINADVPSLYRCANLPAEEITHHAYIPGTPANGLFVAKQGEVLAQIQVRVERALSATGASVIVERIHHPAILEAAQKIAAHLQLSGFFGLDFILHAETGEPWLLEINPRATQLCHIPLDPAHNHFATLADAAYTLAADCATPPPLPPQPIHPRLAFFPQALTLPPEDPILASAFLDRPESEPDLVAEMERPVWPDRRPWLRLYNAINQCLPLR